AGHPGRALRADRIGAGRAHRRSGAGDFASGAEDGRVRPARPARKAARAGCGRCAVMEQVRYTARRLAEILEVKQSELAEVKSSLPAEGSKVLYSVQDLADARARLGKMPARRPMRRQLFLNFK